MGFLSSWITTIGAILKTFQFSDAVDIILVAIIIFSLFKLLRQTRAAQLVKGLIVLVVAYAVSAIFDLTMVNVILTTLFEFAVIILVIVFQPELRRALEHLGRSNISNNSIFSAISNKSTDLVAVWSKAISDVVDAATVFSHSKTGALIVLERHTMLSEISASGTQLNSDTSVALLGNIFFNKAPLHDGACIIRDGKILSAGCILPLTDNTRLNSSLGTRHRAAIGMSEESDAVIVVVSEETGIVSIAVGGKLIRELDRKELYDKLTDLIIPTDNEKQDLFTVLFKNRKEKENEK
ncbi:MAG: TIGR00159 family protein [Ruminococcaceae bacterium]|nr:TIGR00159 family protein [Oscillospiraceae bacterium]